MLGLEAGGRGHAAQQNDEGAEPRRLKDATCSGVLATPDFSLGGVPGWDSDDFCKLGFDKIRGQPYCLQLGVAPYSLKAPQTTMVIAPTNWFLMWFPGAGR